MNESPFMMIENVTLLVHLCTWSSLYKKQGTRHFFNLYEMVIPYNILYLVVYEEIQSGKTGSEPEKDHSYSLLHS